MDRRQHCRCPPDGHQRSIPKHGDRDSDPYNEGQADRWRSHTVDQKSSVRQDGGDGNRRECHAESPHGGRHITGLNHLADSLCDTLRWVDTLAGKESQWCQRPYLLGWLVMDGYWEGREPGGQETRSLHSRKHRMGQLVKSPVRHSNDASSRLHIQERSDMPPLAETHNQNQS